MGDGYTVVGAYEVWLWKEQRKGRFGEYNNKLLEKKWASEWPSECYDRKTKLAFVGNVNTAGPSKYLN